MKRLVVVESQRHLREEIGNMRSNFDSTGTLAVDGERTTIRTVELGGEKWSVKRFKKPNLFNSLVYRWIRPTKARRSFDYAERLLAAGIDTPEPLAYFEERGWRLGRSYYICRHLDYDLDFRVLNHNPNYPERKKILEGVAAFTYRMHQAGIEFLDHSPGNTLIVKQGDAYRYFLIDLNRMRFRSLSLAQRMKNFRRLWLSKTMIAIMAPAYAELSGDNPEEVFRLMSHYSRRFQKKVNSKKLRRRRRRQ